MQPDLPGHDLIAQGLDDLVAGAETAAALLVSIGAPRLRQLGLQVARSDSGQRTPAVRVVEAKRSRFRAFPLQRAGQAARELRAGAGMRPLADATRIQQFMKALGREADRPAHVYLTGGATAVLYGWRESTIDVDMKMVPDLDRVFRSIPEIKERLQINIELASPDDFIPVREGWEDRN